jgi:hypothetical protein
VTAQGCSAQVGIQGGLRVEQGGDLGFGQGSREQVALAAVTAECAEGMALSGRVDSLGDQPEPEGLTQPYDGLDQRVVVS